ncbi:MAG: hypothetical protein ABIJ74_00235 [archaeon]
MDLIYIFGSVIIVSLISFVGLFSIGLNKEFLSKIILYLVSFSAGSLFGGAFIHLLPEAVKENGFGIEVSLYLLSGIIVFFYNRKNHSLASLSRVSFREMRTQKLWLHELNRRRNTQLY